MQILGIKWAPLHVPLERRLQTLAAAVMFVTLGSGGFLAIFFTLYLLLFTRWRWLILIYCGWIYLDRHVCEMGGRPIEWVKNLKLWWYNRDYFPLRLARVPQAELDPKRNYLFCCFPHGILSLGCVGLFGTNASEFHQLFPYHSVRLATLYENFLIPFHRERVLAHGGISVSSNSLNYILSRPEGGKIVILTPGGAAESYYSRPGQYKVLLRKRRGFVKVALKNGTPLVPVIAFGETDLFDQIQGPILYKFQEWLRKYIRIAPLLLIGRGFFQYSFGIIPRRGKVTIVVGSPIDVTKIEEPTTKQVEQLHETFTRDLKNLFEEYKYKYLKEPEDKYLELL